jgi:hypothetical protein
VFEHKKPKWRSKYKMDKREERVITWPNDSNDFAKNKIRTSKYTP